MTAQAAGASSSTRQVGRATGGADSSRSKRLRTYAPLGPFHAYVALFLIFPTVIVAIGAFTANDGSLTFDNIIQVLTKSEFTSAFFASIRLAVLTAIAGALVGGLLAWAVVHSNPNGLFRQLVIAGAGVLAQFGGVMLAFAFFATFGPKGLITLFANSAAGLDLDSSWLYSLNGLAVIYTYFQVPLMLIVFLPSLDGLRQEWYDASSSLGGGSWAFWRHVGGPILAPSFLGAVLLLFTNAFSAYATAAAVISQGCVLVTLQISCKMSSEVVLGQANVGQALALGMIVVVSVVMGAYALIQRRASRWVR
jgi:putative spermidine/putrescine transport system permease protein